MVAVKYLPHRRQSKHKCLFLFLCLSLVSGLCSAADATQTLRQKLLAMQTLQTRFQQTLFNANQEVMQRGRGRLWIKRPVQFRWQQDSPTAQLIIADGQRVYMVDNDLEQVTVRWQKQSTMNTPAAFLSGDAKQFLQAYHVRQQGERFILSPRQDDTAFTRIELTFAGSSLRTIRTRDHLGQDNRITLEQTKVNKALAEKLFHYQVPRGFDVIDETRANSTH